jgi:hypothetical protein
MLKFVTVHFSPAMPSTDERAIPRLDRFKRDMLTLTLGCLAAASMALVLYLAAPAELRDGMVAAFLGLDQPGSSAPAPMPIRM